MKVYNNNFHTFDSHVKDWLTDIPHPDTAEPMAIINKVKEDMILKLSDNFNNAVNSIS